MLNNKNPHSHPRIYDIYNMNNNNNKNIKNTTAIPTFIESPSDSEVKEGNTIQIPCRAQGRPNVRIVWDRINYINGNGNSGNINQGTTTVTEEVSKFLEQETHEELLAKAKIMSLRSKREKMLLQNDRNNSNNNLTPPPFTPTTTQTSSLLRKRRRRRKRNIILMDDDDTIDHQIPDLYIDENARDKRDQDQDFLMSEFKQIMRDENQESYDTTFKKRKRRRRKRDVKDSGATAEEEDGNSESDDEDDDVDETVGSEINVTEPVPTLSFSTPIPPQQLKQLEIGNNGELIFRNASVQDQVRIFFYYFFFPNYTRIHTINSNTKQ